MTKAIKNKKTKVTIPLKWYLHDTEYRDRIINGRDAPATLKNVWITDNENYDESDMFIPFRITRETEDQDMAIAKLIADAPEMYHKLKSR